MKFFIGETEVPLTTNTERLLAAALKAVVLERGVQGGLKSVLLEVELDHSAFYAAQNVIEGDLQIATDTNNGRDLVRIKI